MSEQLPASINITEGEPKPRRRGERKKVGGKRPQNGNLVIVAKSVGALILPRYDSFSTIR